MKRSGGVMYTEILEKIKADPYIMKAIKHRRKNTLKGFCIYALFAFAFAILLCLSANSYAFGWIVSLLCAAMAVSVPAFYLLRKGKEAKIFVGKIERREEDRKIIPQKGTGAFGRSMLKTAEVYELIIAIKDDNQVTQVIFCPSRYEKIMDIGDTILCHSALPYPAHLSNPTKCICMHCGTMQASENSSCITCGASVYSSRFLVR